MTDSGKRQKRWIRPLPERLVNKIAAGEVIERPAAVLKELVENSLDAGATRIEINIEKSGTKSIMVIDNGWGIPAEQVEIAFSRHATSKISGFDDLENLRSYGFRGEALPSIASVSKTRMITKEVDAETGIEIIIEGGVVQSVRPVAAPPGTQVEVDDLFYNTPARRKFLKSEITEARHLSRNAVALALGAPKVSFMCRMNGKLLFSVDPGRADDISRISLLLFGKTSEKLFTVNETFSLMEINGYLSYPEQCRQNRNGVYLFINNRFVTCASIFHAITSGYGELLPRGQYPVGAIFLNVDPAKVDVNVHPTKAEVRLSEERQIHDLLYQAVKRAVRGTSGINSPTILGETKTTMSSSEAIRRIREFRPATGTPVSQTQMKELYRVEPENNEVANIQAFVPPPDRPIANNTDCAEIPRETEKNKDEIAGTANLPETGYDMDRISFLGQLASLYLIFKSDNQIILIDQHTAHERILYEENLRIMESGQAVSQHLLFPLNIELSPEKYLLFEEVIDIINASGFIAEPFGANTVILNAVPISLSRKSPERIFLDILDDIENLREAGYELKKAVAQSVACRAAVMAGDRIESKEALSLFRSLLRTENHHCCPHGRPTIINISREELDVRFGRK